MDEKLLERDPFLTQLDGLLTQAIAGTGRTVLVSGEAGIGKTTLIEHFTRRHRSNTRSLWGACEALFTPRPLGPLHDIAHQSGGEVRALLEHEVDRPTLFAAVLAELQAKAAPTILVMEDVHWADEATLDLIKYLGRRIHLAPALLIITYRDDEIAQGHPLWFVLGDLPSRSVARLQLPPLSESAVAHLAREAQRPAERLHATTGGNPFFVTEVLASRVTGIPITVRDAVLARVARLSPAARSLLELAAVVPTRIEQWIIATILGPSSSEAVVECVDAGVLRQEPAAVAFRHELARQAVESAISVAQSKMLHTRVLHALVGRIGERIEVARLVHHAALAGDGEQVLRLAPLAARQAAERGAHREAVAHYQSALGYADSSSAEARAGLLEELSYECYLTSQMAEAVRAREAALAIWRALDNSEKIGHSLRRLSRLYWFLSQNRLAERHATEAVEILEGLPPARELALAYGNMSQLRMLASDTPGAVLWGQRAIELAERLNDMETVCYALNNIGSAEYCAGEEGGREKLERSLQIALEHGYDEHVARAYNNLAEDAMNFHHHTRAIEYVVRGIAYCVERDLHIWEQCLRCIRAQVRLEQGDWAGADEDVTTILNSPWASPASRGPALSILGSLRARRGDPGAAAILDEARDLLLPTGELQYMAPMAAARAEWKWLHGQREACLAEAETCFQLALTRERPWILGNLALWMWRGGGLTEAPERVPEVYARQIAGGWRAAADAWERIGCPYERALALLEGDESALREALATLEGLDATPAAEVARRRLRALGAKGLPRGPRPATQGNPLGLTTRQFEILQLMAEGLHNTEIANRLSTSPKTIEHHVSAVLAKLAVQSRTQAIARAHQLNLVAGHGATAV